MMMSGCGILTNGRGTRREYGDFNLDELNEGDRIGRTLKQCWSTYSVLRSWAWAISTFATMQFIGASYMPFLEENPLKVKAYLSFVFPKLYPSECYNCLTIFYS